MSRGSSIAFVFFSCLKSEGVLVLGGSGHELGFLLALRESAFVWDDEERGIQKKNSSGRASGFSTGLILLLLLLTTAISDFFVVVCSVVGLYI